MSDWQAVEKTATGPDGAKMAYVGDQWVHAERTATGPDGKKMAVLRQEEPGLSDPLAAAVGLPEKQPQKADVRGMFHWGEGKEVSGGEVAGEVAGGAAAGAVTGAAGPKILEKGGALLTKVPPVGPWGRATHVAGEGMQALGQTLALIPASERTLRGAGGGAASGAVDIAGKAAGAPEAVAFVASAAAGGSAEALTSFAAKEGSKLGSAVFKAVGGNVEGAIEALKGTWHPYKEMNAASASKLQQRLFGEKIDGYIDGLTTSENRAAVQKTLRESDPSLLQAPQAKPTQGAAGVKEEGRELKLPNGQPQLPVGKRDMGKVMAERQAGEEKVKAADAAQLLKPASQIYRERMFDGVGAAVAEGKTYSGSKAAADFQQYLSVMVQQKRLTGKQASDLIGQLSIDKSANPKVRAGFAENMDNAIRTWGKPGEVGTKEGAAAIPQKIAGDVRQKLRESFNAYTESAGLGKVESQYRQAYHLEMVAEAKDKMPAILSGHVKPAAAEDYMRSVMQDPEGAAFIKGALQQHLANTDTKDIAAEFVKQQKLLARAELIDGPQLADMRKMATDIQRVNDKGVQMRALDRFKRMVVTTMARGAGASAGGVAGGAGAGD